MVGSAIWLVLILEAPVQDSGATAPYSFRHHVACGCDDYDQNTAGGRADALARGLRRERYDELRECLPLERAGIRHRTVHARAAADRAGRAPGRRRWLLGLPSHPDQAGSRPELLELRRSPREAARRTQDLGRRTLPARRAAPPSGGHTQ